MRRRLGQDLPQTRQTHRRDALQKTRRAREAPLRAPPRAGASGKAMRRRALISDVLRAALVVRGPAQVPLPRARALPARGGAAHEPRGELLAGRAPVGTAARFIGRRPAGRGRAADGDAHAPRRFDVVGLPPRALRDGPRGRQGRPEGRGGQECGAPRGVAALVRVRRAHKLPASAAADFVSFESRAGRRQRVGVVGVRHRVVRLPGGYSSNESRRRRGWDVDIPRGRGDGTAAT